MVVCHLAPSPSPVASRRLKNTVDPSGDSSGREKFPRPDTSWRSPLGSRVSSPINCSSVPLAKVSFPWPKSRAHTTRVCPPVSRSTFWRREADSPAGTSDCFSGGSAIFPGLSFIHATSPSPRTADKPKSFPKAFPRFWGRRTPFTSSKSGEGIQFRK